jgi:hypothetical protein
VGLRRQERHRRGDHDVGDARQLLGRGLGGGHEVGDDLGGRRKQEHPADDPVQGVEPELQPGGDPEVAAAAADGPEQVRVALVVDLEDLAVGGDELGGEQAVDGQPVLADQVADPAAQGQAADADRGGVAEPGDQPVRLHRGGVGPGGEAGLGPGGAGLGIDLDGGQLREVEHDPALGEAVAGGAVAAGPHGQLVPAVAGQVDHLGDLGGVGRADDGCRAALESAVEDRPGLVVGGVVGGDDAAVDGGPQPRELDGGRG